MENGVYLHPSATYTSAELYLAKVKKRILTQEKKWFKFYIEHPRLN